MFTAPKMRLLQSFLRKMTRGGMLFSVFALAWIVLSRLAVALLSFVSSRVCVCRPEFSIIWLKNNSIHLKPDESFVYIGGVSIL